MLPASMRTERVKRGAKPRSPEALANLEAWRELASAYRAMWIGADDSTVESEQDRQQQWARWALAIENGLIRCEGQRDAVLASFPEAKELFRRYYSSICHAVRRWRLAYHADREAFLGEHEVTIEDRSGVGWFLGVYQHMSDPRRFVFEEISPESPLGNGGELYYCGAWTKRHIGQFVYMLIESLPDPQFFLIGLSPSQRQVAQQIIRDCES